MTLTRETKFVIALAIQLAVIFGMIVYKMSVLRRGVEVNVGIEPVDPRDLLRGDYITFRYPVSNLDRTILRDPPVWNGATVYVILERSGKLWTACSAQTTKPEGDDTLFLQGKVAGGGLESGAAAAEWGRSRSTRIHIVYGIEQYFIPEGKGEGLNLRGSIQPFARVVVDRNGKAVLKQIYIDNRPWP
jgi:uncharacterized membrane-anchored protein